MRSSADTAAPRVLRGVAATSLPKAQVSIELRGSDLMRTLTADARLFDPGLVAAFNELAEAARQAAAQEGFSAGFQAGVEAAQAEEGAARDVREAEFNKQLNGQLTALNDVTIALQQAAADLEVRMAPTYDATVTDLGGAVVTLLTALLAREPGTSADVVRDIAVRAAAHAPRGAQLTLHMHPDQARAVRELGIDLALLVGRPVVVYPDNAIAYGSAIAESAATQIDLSLREALLRVVDELAPDLVGEIATTFDASTASVTNEEATS